MTLAVRDAIRAYINAKASAEAAKSAADACTPLRPRAHAVVLGGGSSFNSVLFTGDKAAVACVKACAQKLDCPPPTSTGTTPTPTGPRATPTPARASRPRLPIPKPRRSRAGPRTAALLPTRSRPDLRARRDRGQAGLSSKARPAPPRRILRTDCASARAAYAAAQRAYDAAARHASITEHAVDLANGRALEAEGAYAGAFVHDRIAPKPRATPPGPPPSPPILLPSPPGKRPFSTTPASVNPFAYSTASAAADQAAADKDNAAVLAADKAEADATIAAGKAGEAFRAARTALEDANRALADANAIAKAAADALSAAEAVLDAAKAAVDAACAPKRATPAPGGGGTPGGTTAGGTCPACDGLRSELASIESQLSDYRNLLQHINRQIADVTDKLDGYTKKQLSSPAAVADKARLAELQRVSREFISKIYELVRNADKLRAAIESCEKTCVPETGRTIPAPGGTGTIPGRPTPGPGGAGAGGNCPACDGLRKELRDIELMLRVYQEWFDDTTAKMRGYTDKMLKGPLAGADLAKLDGLGDEAKQLDARIRALTDNADCATRRNRKVRQELRAARCHGPAAETRDADRAHGGRLAPGAAAFRRTTRPVVRASATAAGSGGECGDTRSSSTAGATDRDHSGPAADTDNTSPVTLLRRRQRRRRRLHKPPVTTPTLPANPPAAPAPSKPPGFSGTWAGNGAVAGFPVLPSRTKATRCWFRGSPAMALWSRRATAQPPKPRESSCSASPTIRSR